MSNKIAGSTLLVSVGYTYLSALHFFINLTDSFTTSVYLFGYAGLVTVSIFAFYAVLEIGKLFNQLESLKGQLSTSNFHHIGRIHYLERRLEIFEDFFNGEIDHTGFNERLRSLEHEAQP